MKITQYIIWGILICYIYDTSREDITNESLDTHYVVSCFDNTLDDQYDVLKCFDDEKNLRTYREIKFRVNKNTHEVVENSNNITRTLLHCSVYDASNWSCNDREYVVNHGRLITTDKYSIEISSIAYYRWYWMGEASI